VVVGAGRKTEKKKWHKGKNAVNPSAQVRALQKVRRRVRHLPHRLKDRGYKGEDQVRVIGWGRKSQKPSKRKWLE